MIDLRKELEARPENVIGREAISYICRGYGGLTIISFGGNHLAMENTFHLKVEILVRGESRIDQYWLKDGKFHKEGGPAIEIPNLYQTWYIDGKIHREDGPAERYPEFKSWYKNGKRHREDGPAIEYDNGDKSWYKDGLLHREDGPAVDWTNQKIWYLEGERYSEEEYNEILKSKKTNNIHGFDFVNLDDLIKYFKQTKDPQRQILIETINKYEAPITDKDLDSLKDERRVHVRLDHSEFMAAHYWYKNGKLHRENGPAREDWNGIKMWYLEGKRYSEEEYNKIMNKPKEMDLFPLTLLGSLVLLKSVGNSFKEQVSKDVCIMKGKEDGIKRQI